MFITSRKGEKHSFVNFHSSFFYRLIKVQRNSIGLKCIKPADLVTILGGLSLRLITKKFLKHKIIQPKMSAIDLVY